eukprot:CAMPEP_0170972222 /NCGR_PEP_ID=MMETSP0735-20130129/45900_1 /TAXON_ID=186038 /ORGANISM="Fragilariopsis kerguelensis, Strain L26-C5" /LENGTH=887 /DNA_ID=CAMNT_0011392751 /DNA_START=66 /DNA_END=2729 /DNA_ORIENTATION=+
MRIAISRIVLAFVFIAGMVVDAAPAACIDDPKLEFHVGKKKRNCKWVSKDTKSRCKKKEKKGLKLKLKVLCPATCDHCPATCDHCPAKPPTDTPVVVVPTPTPPTDGNGCCSLDFKNCINYCGTDYNSCMTCNSNDIVGWIKSDAFQTQCGQRWTGCGESNNINHSGCCEGLTCQFPNGPYYSACLPPDVNTNPVSPPTPTPVTTPVSNPVSPPTTAPVSNPVSPPTTTPVSNPVSPPTNDGGGGGELKSGKATFYGGNESGGACGYNDLPQVTFPLGFSVAIGADEFDNGYGCGACYEVTCTGPYSNNPNCFCGDSENNKVIVQATDQCPECESTHFDLNSNAFTSIIAGQSSSMAGTCGVLETQFRRVSCNFQSNIMIRSKSGTSGYWYGLHIDDVAGYGAIKQVKLREAGRRNKGQNQFDIVCDKSEGASFWICDRPNNREIFASLDVELKDSAGRTLRSNNVITNLLGGETFDFGKNFGPIDDEESPIASPTSPVSQPTTPTKSPVKAPTSNPVSAPTPTPPTGGNGCCSLDYKNCVGWCESSYDDCMKCDNKDVTWLSNGPPQGQCMERWTGCDGNPNGCCDGLTCRWRDGEGYNACLPNLNPTPSPVPAPPTRTPTYAPTVPVEPTISPAPTPESSLLSTDKAMDAWAVFEGLDYITHKNSGDNYALVASGGAAGSGNLVVSESQAYGLLITGTILASWDTHADKVQNSNRSEVLKYFEGYYNFWKQMCKDSSNKSTNCQSGGNYCKDSNGGSSVCLPDWRHYKTGGSESTGPAPDADEDAIVGIILAVKAVENDANKPSWYNEARKWADASATAFVEFETDNSKADFRLVKLGSCWGGWGGQGNNPSYHSPGSFRVMKDYQKSFPNNLRVGVVNAPLTRM